MILWSDSKSNSSTCIDVSFISFSNVTIKGRGFQEKPLIALKISQNFWENYWIVDVSYLVQSPHENLIFNTLIPIRDEWRAWKSSTMDSPFSFHSFIHYCVKPSCSNQPPFYFQIIQPKDKNKSVFTEITKFIEEMP